MATAIPTQDWVYNAIAGAAKIGEDVRPVLLMEQAPQDWLQRLAAEKDVHVMWRTDGEIHNAPW